MFCGEFQRARQGQVLCTSHAFGTIWLTLLACVGGRPPCVLLITRLADHRMRDCHTVCDSMDPALSSFMFTLYTIYFSYC